MGDLKEQFSSIYDQYIEKIYRFVYLKVNSQEIAEDLTSKVFLKGWEAYKNQSTELPDKSGNLCSAERRALNLSARRSGPKSKIENPGAFLYQIARNAVIDYYREKGRTKIVSAENAPQTADPAANLHDKAILNSDISAIKTVMQKLKKDYQDIIIWHYLDDMPINEIAKTLNKPAGTIRVMLHRGLKDLKNLIKES